MTRILATLCLLSGCRHVGPTQVVESFESRMAQRAQHKLSDSQSDSLEEPAGPLLHGRGVVELWIQSEDDVDLRLEGPEIHVYPSRTYRWEYEFSPRVCVSPCGLVVDGAEGQSFYFSGDGAPNSASFTLTGMEGEMTAVVDAGSSLMHGVAVISLVAAVGTGIWFTASAAIEEDPQWHLGITSLLTTATAITLFKVFATTYSFVEGGPQPPAS